MDKAECNARGLEWPLWECITGDGDFTQHPREERFDFPCSTMWREYYSGAPEVERRQEEEPRLQVEFTRSQGPAKIVLEAPKTKPRSKGVEL